MVTPWGPLGGHETFRAGAAGALRILEHSALPTENGCLRRGRQKPRARSSSLSPLGQGVPALGHDLAPDVAAAHPTPQHGEPGGLVQRGDTGTADTPTAWVQGSDLQPVLAAADAHDKDGRLAHPRTAVLIRLLILYGLRVSEATWLTLGDLVEGAHGTELRVRGKVDVVDHVDLDQDICDALAAWLKERTALLEVAGLNPAVPALPLILSRRGRGISR